jgi:hypothetical protein
MHVYLTMLIRKGRSQVRFTGAETPIHLNRALRFDGYLLKSTRSKIESDVNCVHADVSFSLNNQVLEKAG